VEYEGGRDKGGLIFSLRGVEKTKLASEKGVSFRRGGELHERVSGGTEKSMEFPSKFEGGETFKVLGSVSRGEGAPDFIGVGEESPSFVKIGEGSLVMNLFSRKGLRNKEGKRVHIAGRGGRHIGCRWGSLIGWSIRADNLRSRKERWRKDCYWGSSEQKKKSAISQREKTWKDS